MWVERRFTMGCGYFCHQRSIAKYAFLRLCGHPCLHRHAKHSSLACVCKEDESVGNLSDDNESVGDHKVDVAQK